MNLKNCFILISISLYICLFLLLSSALLIAQDSTKVKADSVKISADIPQNPQIDKATDSVSTISDVDVIIGEVELLEITIEAVVEKPRVSIMPKRLDPKLNEMEFIDRSFEDELKKGPDKPFLVKERAKLPDKIEQLRDKINKNENKE